MDPDFDCRAVKRWRRDVWRAFEHEGLKASEIVAATVMAAVAIVGTDCLVLSVLTGVSPNYARTVLRRLRKEGIVRGRSMRVVWAQPDVAHSSFGILLDAMTAAGILSRQFANEKQSAAQKARSPETRARGPRGRRIKTPAGVAPLRPVKSNPLYGLPEWLVK